MRAKPGNRAADWLQTLPTKDGAQYLDSPKMHLSSDDFHAKFYSSERGKEILEKLRSEPQQNECEQSKDSTKSDETIKTLYKKNKLGNWLTISNNFCFFFLFFLLFSLRNEDTMKLGKPLFLQNSKTTGI